MDFSNTPNPSQFVQEYWQVNDAESFPAGQLNLDFLAEDVDNVIQNDVPSTPRPSVEVIPETPPRLQRHSTEVIPETPVAEMGYTFGDFQDVPLVADVPRPVRRRPVEELPDEETLPSNYLQRENIKRDARSRSWVGTWNNYPPGAQMEILTMFDRYGIVGREVGEKGTPHLQIYGVFKNPRKWSSMHEDFPRVWWAPAKGDALQNYTYCSKGGDFEVYPKPFHLAVRRCNCKHS